MGMGEADDLLVPVLDARMQELYVGGYAYQPDAESPFSPVIPEQLCNLSRLDEQLVAYALS